MKLPLLLATLEQFEDQATNRLLLSLMEEYGDSGTIQKEGVKKTPAKCYHQVIYTVSLHLNRNSFTRYHTMMWNVGRRKKNVRK